MAKNGFTAVSYNMFAASLGSNTIPWLVPEAFVSYTVTCCDSKFAWKYRWCWRSNVEVIGFLGLFYCFFGLVLRCALRVVGLQGDGALK
jgi:hypothetical protein